MQMNKSLVVFCGLVASILIMTAASADQDAASTEIRPLDYENVNLDQFTTDTQLGTPDPDRLLLLWWLPVDYWKVTFAQDDEMSQRETDEIVELMEPYIIIAVVDAQLGMFGNAKYRSMGDIAKQMWLVGTDGDRVRPIRPRDIDGDVRMLMDMMKPVLSNLMGPLGEHMYFFVFPKESKGEALIGSCVETGTLTLSIDGEPHSFHTPLPSMIEDKACGECDRRFRGDYVVCPYDSDTLRYD